MPLYPGQGVYPGMGYYPGGDLVVAEPGGPIRLWLTNTTAPLPGQLPTNLWEQSAGLVRGLLGRTPSGTNTETTVAETSTSATHDVLLGLWVSEPMVRAGSISGPVTAVVSCRESDAAANLTSYLVVAVVNSAGTTVRGGTGINSVVEWPTTSTATTVTVTLSPVSAQVGDRIVVEYGFRTNNTSATSYSGSIRYGGAASPVALAVGDTADVAATLPPHVTLPVGADLFERGTPFMQDTLGPGARLAVEVAWGADLTADPATWLWSDITGDVRMDGKVKMKIGRGDEASKAQPAKCTMTLDNRAGLYSQGGQCPNWPYIRRNTPVRVRVLLPGADAWVTRFEGGAIGWTPEWDSTGVDATTVLEAAGTRRRLEQGTTPVLSSLRRALGEYTTARAYWPCEDPAGSTAISSAIAGHPPMTITGTAELPYPKFAGDDESFVCSAPLPVVNGSTWRGVVPPYTSTGQIQVRFLLAAPEQMTGTDQTILTLYTAGTIARWELRYTATTGGLAFDAYNTSGTLVLGTGSIGFKGNNTTRRYEIALTQTGGNIAYSFSTLTAQVGGDAGVQSGTLSTHTLGRATAVVINPSGLITDTAIGHIIVRDTTAASIYDDQAELNGNTAERVDTRLTRLAAENAIPLTLMGAAARLMGPQPVAPILTLLDECEVADQGSLFDGLATGLTYTSYDYRRDRPADLVLAADGGDLARAIEPVDDDQRTVNKVTVERLRGASFTAIDTDGPRGTTATDVYDSSVKASLYYDENARDLAGWLVGQGTVEGYRHPSLPLDLARNPNLAPDWVALTPGARIDVTGVDQVRPQHPAGVVSLLLEGWSEQIDQFRWNVEATCSPYAPWRVGLAATDTGDTGEFVARATGGSSTLAATAAAGATTLSVATPAADPLWTTAADDYPLTLSVGGIQVTATACSGGSSPQTFTVSGATVTKVLAAGSSVDVWLPTVVGK